MKKFTKILALVAVVLVALFAFLGGASDKYIFATGGSGGTYYTYGNAIATLTTNISDTKITAVTGKGSKNSIQRVNAGRVKFAIVQNDVAYYAYTGTDLFADQGKQEDFRIVGYMYSEPCQIVAREGINSIIELRGKKVSVGVGGSGVEFNAKQILAAYGMSFDDINAQHLDFNGSAAALQDGQIDAFFCVA